MEIQISLSNAGGVCNQVGTSLEEVESSGWKTIFAANVDSALHLAQSFVPAMKATRWGRVITISSGGGTATKPDGHPCLYSSKTRPSRIDQTTQS